MDESKLSIVPNKSLKVISKLGKHAVEKLSSAERSTLITVGTCSVNVPPSLIFSRKRAKEELLNGVLSVRYGIHAGLFIQPMVRVLTKTHSRF